MGVHLSLWVGSGQLCLCLVLVSLFLWLPNVTPFAEPLAIKAAHPEDSHLRI